jgi:antitoxin (DNA-binding transcriptional repressor) of toxin-antitoxin stability system
MAKKSDHGRRPKRRAGRLSATQASRSFARLLDEVEAGSQFLIHRRGKDVCLMSAPPLPGRTASQALEILRSRVPVRLDGRFGADLRAIIAAESTDRSPWDS